MDVNWAEGVYNPEESDNHSQVEFGNGGDDYQNNWGVRLAMLGMQASQLIPQVI